MKKLSLKNLKLETNDMLQRNQLKTVFGGYEGNDDKDTILTLCINSTGQVIGQLCLDDCYPTLYHCRQAYGPSVVHKDCQGSC